MPATLSKEQGERDRSVWRRKSRAVKHDVRSGEVVRCRPSGTGRRVSAESDVVILMIAIAISVLRVKNVVCLVDTVTQTTSTQGLPW